MSKEIKRVLEKFYTLGEVPRRMGLTRVTLWRKIKSGEIKVQKIGRETLIEKAFVRRYQSKAA